MRSLNTLILVALAVSYTLPWTNAHVNDDLQPTCIHHRIKENPGRLEVHEAPLPSPDRVLQTSTTSTYPNIRIGADYSNLLSSSATSDFITYVQTQLVPAVIDYYQAAIAVKQPLTNPLKVPSSLTQMCDLATPKALFTGVSNDFYVVVSSTVDSTSNWVASATSCFLSSSNSRPLIAQLLFNTYYTKTPNGDPLIHEKNMYLTMHEMLHAFGFSGSSFKNFIDASGNPLQNQLKSVTLNGSVRTVLDVEPLTTRLRQHFGCSTLPGAFLENDGGAGTAGSHFERRHFLNEVMTSGVIQGLRMSEFSFAVLEGSGWYQPNYTYVDPFFVGQGEGCSFLYQACNGSPMNFDEFCPSLSARGCAAVGIAGGVCSTDTRSDNCSYFIPVLQYDCQSPDAVAYASLPSVEVYDRAAGSMCFNGNLTKYTKGSQSTYCFTYNCNGSGLNTTVDIIVGTAKATCTAAGTVKVAGYNGLLTCPDPLQFCNTVGKKYCPLNCMGRGTCVNNQCQCKSGFTGIDCALKA